MCGISGILSLNNQPINRDVLERINRTLTHRGPDSEGYFLQEAIGLGHRRLSIIDIASGTQPMTSSDGRYTLVFNGEIYNFLELRRGLEEEGVKFTTHSDTEVLLYLYATQKEKCLSGLNGMFAFAVWDNQNKSLFIARDRFGKKPLYYFKDPQHFIFASEPKSLLAHPTVTREMNPQAAAHYFQYEYVPAPFSIYEGIHKLPQGHFLTVQNGTVTIQPYWDVPLTSEKLAISEEEAEGEIERLLEKAVMDRLVSDVPLGVFLSGGIDSSAIVALMARHREGKSIKTFSINFNEKTFDESSYSNLIAKKFNTDHYSQVLDPKKMIDILPNITSFMDEPFADYSIIPTYLLSAFTRQHVTVALGGDGSDEIFAGYPTFHAGLVAERFNQFPGFFKKVITGLVNSLPTSDKDMSFEFKLKQFIYGAHFSSVLRNQVWLGAFHAGEMQNLFTPEFLNQTGSINPLALVTNALNACSSRHPGDQMLYFYQKFYLTDDILVKTDRASMAHSLEVRAPFLDINLINFVSKLPYEWKSKGNVTKYILKKVVDKFLPHEIVHRPKKGFGIPIAAWLKSELKDEMLRTLNPQKLAQAGIFNPKDVTRLVDEHLSGKKNNRKPLFSLLMFEWWREKWGIT